jgi:hypothetical protein
MVNLDKTPAVKLVKFLRSIGFSVTIGTGGSDVDTTIAVHATGEIGGKSTIVTWNVFINGDMEGHVNMDGFGEINESGATNFSVAVHDLYTRLSVAPKGRTWIAIEELLAARGFEKIHPAATINTPVSTPRMERFRDFRETVPTVEDIKDTSLRCSVFQSGITTVVIAERDPSKRMKCEEWNGSNEVTKMYRKFYGVVLINGAFSFHTNKVTEMLDRVTDVCPPR